MIHGLLDQLQPDASDDEDDEVGPEAEFVFQTMKSDEATGAPRPGDCHTLLVCNPGAATAFVLAAFPELQPVPWQLDLTQQQSSRSFPPKPPRFLTSGGTSSAVAAVLLEAPVPSDMSAAWTEVLLSSFDTKVVLFLDRVFRAGWQAPERPLEPHLSGLWTRAWAGAAPCARLPVRNALEGLGAALLTQCEAEGRCCIAALALQDGAHLGEGCVRAFAGLAPLLQEHGVLPADWKQPNYAEAVRRVVSPSSMSIYA